MTARDDHAAPAAQTPDGLREAAIQATFDQGNWLASPGPEVWREAFGFGFDAGWAARAAFPGPTDETRAEVETLRDLVAEFRKRDEVASGVIARLRVERDEARAALAAPRPGLSRDTWQDMVTRATLRLREIETQAVGGIHENNTRWAAEQVLRAALDLIEGVPE